ncbi:maltose O-acetyltransferase/hypothetical protein [Diaminobutyricimonas aerilata]|uniref:Maltose O-acetyltransferase n=1 Tax=Diaminobutyricimonas aerilata TaxID=1162967 RepID=A0A2M9CIZ0_9MICO|nr:DapH/DapD/GlmU-related protein [Diaminobutyricimonas aerilata]PJJ71854.1 maltose O-acetyltransferase/hypothetical protein [Diaminobutyricimonas aerilata]
MASRYRGRLANVIAASGVWSPRTRARILRRLGARLDPSARVHPYVRFIGRVDEFSMGAGSFLNLGVVIGSNAPVTLGRRVAIGPGVQLLPTTHKLGTSDHRWGGGNVSSPITIEDGVWVGAGATILGGVTIGRGTVIAAGAVVTKDCEPDSVYGGVPAKLIRVLENAE